MLIYLGWLGDVLLASGLYGVGSKKRNAFLLSIAGESLWIVKSVALHQWDLAAICVIFLAMAARGWWKWGNS